MFSFIHREEIQKVFQAGHFVRSILGHSTGLLVNQLGLCRTKTCASVRVIALTAARVPVAIFSLATFDRMDPAIETAFSGVRKSYSAPTEIPATTELPCAYWKTSPGRVGARCHPVPCSHHPHPLEFLP